MNIVSILGLIISIVVFFLGLKMSSDRMDIFIDYPSLFIVLGGSFGAVAVCYQITRIFTLFKIFLRHITGANKVDYSEMISDIMKIGDAYRRGESLEGHINKVRDHFLKEALEIVNDGILEPEHITRLLSDRANNMNYMHMEDATKIKTMAQFPPAFGAIGTTIGMIVLLANLGGDDAMKMIGPAMSVALITTLYGGVASNMVIIPIAENLIEASKQAHVKNLIIIEGIKHLLNKANPVVVAEELNSFLPPSQRLDWKEIIGK